MNGTAAGVSEIAAANDRLACSVAYSVRTILLVRCGWPRTGLVEGAGLWLLSRFTGLQGPLFLWAPPGRFWIAPLLTCSCSSCWVSSGLDRQAVPRLPVNVPLFYVCLPGFLDC